MPAVVATMTTPLGTLAISLSLKITSLAPKSTEPATNRLMP